MYCSSTPAFHTSCWAAPPSRGFGQCSFLGSTLRKSTSPFPEVPRQVLSEQSGCKGSAQALQSSEAGCRTFVQPGQCLAGPAALSSEESQCWALGGCRLAWEGSLPSPLQWLPWEPSWTEEICNSIPISPFSYVQGRCCLYIAMVTLHSHSLWNCMLEKY